MFFKNIVVISQEDHKHLGVILDRSLSFAKHIREENAAARKGIGLIRHVSPYVPLHTLDQMYKIFVRPHLDYCDVIYHVPPHQEPGSYNSSLNYLMKSIESTQYEAARAVTGTWKGTSINYTRNWVGSRQLIEESQEGLFNSIKFIMVLLQLT